MNRLMATRFDWRPLTPVFPITSVAHPVQGDLGREQKFACNRRHLSLLHTTRARTHIPCEYALPDRVSTRPAYYLHMCYWDAPAKPVTL
eukprot:953762-Pelagomonas_calceolata.AAC.1